MYLERGGDYEMSDSDDDYTEREKNLLKNVRKGRKKDDSDEEEIYGFDDDSEPEKFEAESDFDEPEDGDDGLPDDRAWGKKKSTFYNTDFHDQDYRGYTEKEEEVANQEQAEALLIQKRLATELNETDFNLDMFILPDTEKDPAEPVVKSTKTDLSDLSKKQKIALFKSEAPEFDGLVQDFEDKVKESKDLLLPTLQLFKSIDFPKHPLIDFIASRYQLITTYCTNISFYLMLKAKRVKVTNHPMVKRLVQFRQLISQTDDIFDYVVKPQLEALLAETAEDSDEETESPKLRMLKNLKDELETKTVSVKAPAVAIQKPRAVKKDSSDSEEEEEKMEEGDEDEIDEETGLSKREITRQIAKNKGLTATKRRELRNPRVKKRKEYRKALIRRKGAIREVRSKVDLYGGEASGVKTHIKRSIKLK